jgi:hypothetical protein
MTKISGGSARGGQGMLFLLCVPFIFVLFYSMIMSKPGLDIIIILLLFILAILMFLYKSSTYADIYVTKDIIFIKKLFSSKKRTTGEVKDVGQSLLPYTFYFQFEDKKKYSFSRKPLI